MADPVTIGGLIGGFVILIWLIGLLIGLVSLAATIFWIWMIIDCAKRDFKDKVVWILIIVFLHILGAVIYYFVVKRPAKK